MLPHHEVERLGMVGRRTAAILEGGNPEIPVSPGMQSILAAMSGTIETEEQ